MDRLEKMVAVLLQFIDPERLDNKQTKLRISRYKASLLNEMKKAFAQVNIAMDRCRSFIKIRKTISEF